MTERMYLEHGAQHRAAGLIQTCAESVNTECSTLSEALATSAPGFKGAAAAGFVTAINAWFAQAEALPKVLREYAAALAAVDASVARADSAGSKSLSASNPSGLNLDAAPGSNATGGSGWRAE